MRFASFFMAGFECATGFNSGGEWIDEIAATAHDRYLDRDYAAVAECDIRTIRDGIRWPVVDRGRCYDFSSVEPLVDASTRHGMQVIWDLFHYGYPADLDPFTDAFIDRFAAYCYEVARFLSERLPGPLLFTPVNEPSYLAWAGGESAQFAPYRRGQAYELKIQLCRAAIQGTNAIWSVCPDARIVTADPVCRVVAPYDRADMDEAVCHFNEVAVFESLDMISGRLLPELGGSEKHLDILGINYYGSNQWVLGQDEIALAHDDPRRISFHDIVAHVYKRYGHEMVITETSHDGDMRAPWFRHIAEEVETLLNEGVPVRGVCLYPILGMPLWHEQNSWKHMGMWDLDVARDLERVRHDPLCDALKEWQERLKPISVTQLTADVEPPVVRRML